MKQEKMSYQKQKQCRICLNEDQQLIVPCNCTGSVKYVHEACIRQWTMKNFQQIKSKNQNPTCQICKFKLLYTSTSKLKCIECKKIAKNIKRAKALFIVLIFLLISSLAGMSWLSYIFNNRDSYGSYLSSQNPNSWIWVVILTCIVITVLVSLKCLYEIFFYFFQFSEQITSILQNIKAQQEDQVKNNENQNKNIRIQTLNTSSELFSLNCQSKQEKESSQNKMQIQIVSQNLIISMQDEQLQSQS